jgi:hypothetical protein
VPEHTCKSCFVFTLSLSLSTPISRFVFLVIFIRCSIGTALRNRHTDLDTDNPSAKHKLAKMTAEEREKTVKAPSYDKTTEASEGTQPAVSQDQALEAQHTQTLEYTGFQPWVEDSISNAPEQSFDQAYQGYQPETTTNDWAESLTPHQPRPRSPDSPPSRYRYPSPPDYQQF